MQKKTITLTKPTWKHLSELRLKIDADTLDDTICRLIEIFEKKEC